MSRVTLDITRLEHELRHIEPLFSKIRDRRDRLLQDISCCKALLAPIRRLPRETLLQVFDLLSSQSSDVCNGPWVLGHVCSTWPMISRSCPSLLISSPCGSYTLLNEYASLSGNLPIQLTVSCDSRYGLDGLHALVPHSQRWSSLDLNISPETLSELLSSISLPLIRLSTVNIAVNGEFEPPHHHRMADDNPFSSSPITEATLHRIPYSYMPINVRVLQRFRVCSYDPAEIHSIFRNSQHLIEIVITTCPTPRFLNVEPLLPITYPPVVHTSLRQLSFVLTWENARRITKIPVTLDYITLPALNEFQILASQTQPLPGILPGTLEPIEYSRIINLVHRCGCDLTDLTFSVPVPVSSFLLPMLRQSPALEKLDIFVDADTAGDVFRVLTLAEGKVPNLKKLRIADAPCRGAVSGLLLEGDAFRAMVRSRLSGDSHLKSLQLSLKTTWSRQDLLIPIARDSPLRDLVKMKEEGLDVEFLFNLEDCLLEGEAFNLFFGSS